MRLEGLSALAKAASTPTPSPSVISGPEKLQIFLAALSLILVAVGLFFGGRGFIPWILRRRRAKGAREKRSQQPLLNSLPERPAFIGRDSLVQQCLMRLIQAPGLVIDGPRGSGKSTLALEVAHRYFDSRLLAQERRPRYVAWVSLRQRTPTALDVLDEIAHKLGFQAVLKADGLSKASVMAHLLAGSEALLVLDNIESIQDLPETLGALGDLPAGVKVIVTTSVSIAAVNYAIQPVAGMEAAEAVELMQREARRDSRLSTRSLSHADLEEIWSATGGLPLAMMWSLGRLRDGLELKGLINELQSGRGSLFDDLFAQTWRTLTDEERRCLAILTMLPNELPRSVLGSVCSDGSSTHIAAVLESLMAKRIIEHKLRSLAASEESIFGLHPLAFRFASQRRVGDEEHRAIVSAATQCYRTLMDLRWEGGTEEDLSWVGLELSNMLATIDLAQALDASTGAVKLAVPVEEALLHFGLLEEREKYGLALADIATNSVDEPDRCRLLTAAGQAAGLMGKYARSGEILADALADAKASDLDAQVVRVTRAMAANAYRQGDLEATEALLADLPAMAEASRDRYALVDVLYLASNFEFIRGELSASEAHCNEILRIVAVEHIYERARAYALEQLALVYLQRDSLIDAKGAVAAGLTVAISYQDRRQLARLQLVHGKLALRGFAPWRARSLVKQALGEFERLGLENESLEARAVLDATRGVKWLLRRESRRASFSGLPLGGD